jgi:hypothetical protein
MAPDFSGSCIVTSCNPLIHKGASKDTKSLRLDAEGATPCHRRAPAAMTDGSLATVNFGEAPQGEVPSIRLLCRWVMTVKNQQRKRKVSTSLSAHHYHHYYPLVTVLGQSGSEPDMRVLLPYGTLVLAEDALVG